MSVDGNTSGKKAAKREMKTVPFSVRIEPSVKTNLKTQGAAHGVSAGLFVRRLIRESQSGEHQFFPNELDELEALRKQVAAIGRNVNQMAKRLNRVDAAHLIVLDSDRENLSALKVTMRDVVAQLKLLEGSAKTRTVQLRKAGGKA